MFVVPAPPKGGTTNSNEGCRKRTGKSFENFFLLYSETVFSDNWNNKKMTKEKVFINNNNMARFTCPKCQDRIVMDVSEYKDIDKAIVIKHECKCGLHSTLLLERRQFYRRKVSIPGTYILDRHRRTMIVKNLSRAGLKFEPELKKEDIKIGDRLTVEFRLDNVKIKKKVLVKTVSDTDIGTEFCSKDPESSAGHGYDKAITSYLLQKMKDEG